MDKEKLPKKSKMTGRSNKVSPHPKFVAYFCYFSPLDTNIAQLFQTLFSCAHYLEYRNLHAYKTITGTRYLQSKLPAACPSA